MNGAERGFTLVETVVTIGILAVLLAAGGAWYLAMHPGALMHATADYDATLASARGVAATSGNGATLVFAPRTGGAAGFTLRVYSGRPASAAAVQPTTAMPVESDVTVSEATLGKPPFAIFIGASGHASGKASYPVVDAAGNATFPIVAIEPACPVTGFVLTFTSPQGATATRSLPCTPSASAAPGGPGNPNPSPTPNVPIVTPTSLIYHWPADAQQRFVATEWGYTHWFASTTGLTCGASIATYPDVLPDPYSSPMASGESALPPPPPVRTPFSYPNSHGGSTNDAPAPFPLDPSTEGLCTATVRDGFGQKASTAVDVMGWLTVTYGGRGYTHITGATLTLPASALGKRGARVMLPLSKRYDAEPLQPNVQLDAACSKYVTIETAAGTTPVLPSATPATASIALVLATLPGSKIACGGTIYDQYVGSLEGEGVPFNATIDPEGPLQAWPPAESFAAPGSNIGTVAAPFPTKPCLAVAYSTGFAAPLGNVTKLDAAGAILVQTDANGCILDASGAPLSGGATATQTGYTGVFGYYPASCAAYLNFAAAWSSSGTGPGADLLKAAGIKPTSSDCAFQIVGDLSVAGGASPSPVTARVVGCAWNGNTVIAPINQPCEFDLPITGGTEPCVNGDERPPYPMLTTYYASFSDATGHGVGLAPVLVSPEGVLRNTNGSATFTRTAPGTVSVYIIKNVESAHAAGIGCAPGFDTSTASTITFTN